MTVRNRSRNLARYRKEHQCSVWHTEVQLFPEGDGETAVFIKEKLCDAELEEQGRNAEAIERPEGDGK